MLLDQHKYVPILSKILVGSADVNHQMTLLQAINNFVNRNPKDLLKEKALMTELCTYLDRQDELSIRCLYILKGSLSFTTIVIKEEIMKEIGWPRIITCLKSKNIEISRLAILIVLHYLNENVPEFVSSVE